jgi:hypothetical protein
MKRHLRHIFIIFAASFLTYYSSLDYFFITDDFMWLSIAKKATSGFFNVFALTRFHEFRPIVSFSFFLNYLLFGLNPAGYHFTNITIHAINSVLVYSLLQQIMKDKKISLLGALIFDVSYSHFGSVVWISGRTGLLGSFFYLSSFLLFLKGGKMKGVSLLFFIFSLFCVEYMFTLPFILLSYQLIFKGRKELGKALRSTMPFFIIMIAFLFFQYNLQAGKSIGAAYIIPKYRYLGLIDIDIITKNLLQALAILWMPFKQTKYFVLPLSPLIQAILLVTIYTVAASFYILLKGSKEMRFGIAWSYIALLPFLFLTVNVFPRYMYLSAVGFSLIFACLIKIAIERFDIKSSQKRIWALAFVLLLFMASHAVFNIREGERSFNGRSTEEVVRGLLATYPEFPANSTLMFVDFPLDEGVMEYIIELYYPTNPTVYAVDRRHVTANVFKDKEVLVLYFKDGRIVKEKGLSL